MKDRTVVPIRVRGHKEILDIYYNYFMEHFTKKKDSGADHVL